MEDALIQFVIEHADLLRRFRLSANKRVTMQRPLALLGAVNMETHVVVFTIQNGAITELTKSAASQEWKPFNTR